MLGINLGAGPLEGVDILGALAITLRSPQPLLTANTIAPQFYDVHMQLEFEHWRLVVGQYPDVILPVVPETINSYPVGFVPGAFWYVTSMNLYFCQLLGIGAAPWKVPLLSVLSAASATLSLLLL